MNNGKTHHTFSSVFHVFRNSPSQSGLPEVMISAYSWQRGTDWLVGLNPQPIVLTLQVKTINSSKNNPCLCCFVFDLNVSNTLMNMFISIIFKIL